LSYAFEIKSGDKMIITISGNAGSGKSTVAKKLVSKLNAKRIYVGGIRRQLAKEKGMTLEELNEYGNNHPETDVDVDKKAAKQALELDSEDGFVVVEGRVQFHFLPDSVKVMITVNQDEGARRIWNDLQKEELKQERNEGDPENLDELKRSIETRETSDAFRFQQYYHLDYRDKKNYDLVIDSTNVPAEEIADKIVAFVKK